MMCPWGTVNGCWKRGAAVASAEVLPCPDVYVTFMAFRGVCTTQGCRWAAADTSGEPHGEIALCGCCDDTGSTGDREDHE